VDAYDGNIDNLFLFWPFPVLLALQLISLTYVHDSLYLCICHFILQLIYIVFNVFVLHLSLFVVQLCWFFVCCFDIICVFSICVILLEFK